MGSATLTQSLFTIALGFIGGLLFYVLGLPAPFMLGSLVICWLLGGLFDPIRDRLGMSVTMRRGFLALVAVLLGSYADAGAVRDIVTTWPSVIVLIASGMAMAWGCTAFLKWRGIDPVVAWFSSQPAGLSEVVLTSRDYTDKDHIVALFHLIRVSTIFMCMPIIVWFVASDFDARAVPVGQVHFWQASWSSWPLMALLGAAGVIIAPWLRLPMKWLLGPLFLTCAWSIAVSVWPQNFPSWTSFDRPFELVCFVQLALGASIGARMAQVRFGEFKPYILDSYLNAFLMLVIALVGALVLAAITGQPVLKFLFAISPGGLSEISLLAVAVGYEVAFITLHHLIRMAAVLSLMPLGMRGIERRKSS